MKSSRHLHRNMPLDALCRMTWGFNHSPLVAVAMAATVLLSNLRIISAAPFAASQQATAISLTGASLNGMVTPRGGESRFWFEWGPDSGFGQSSSPVTLADGAGLVS